MEHFNKALYGEGGTREAFTEIQQDKCKQSL